MELRFEFQGKIINPVAEVFAMIVVSIVIGNILVHFLNSIIRSGFSPAGKII